MAARGAHPAIVRMVAVTAILGATLAAVVLLRPDAEPTGPVPAGPEPAAVVECASERRDDYDCWRERLRELVWQESPGAALADARAAYDEVPLVAANCHQLAHEIGRAAGDRYGDVAQAYAEGDDFCWSGYFHGVMEAVAAQVGTQRLLAEVEDVCTEVQQEHPYGSDHYNCVHGLGHGLMAVTYAQLYEALAGCDGFTDPWERQSCYGGVFMENIMSKDNPHHTTEYLTDDDPLYPCTEVAEVYKQQCYLMQTSHALAVLDYDYRAVFALCATVDEQYRETCQQSLGRDISGNTMSDVDRTVELCMLGETEAAQLNCFIGAAKDYIHYFHNDTESLRLCAAIENEQVSDTCTRTAQAHYSGL